LIDLRTFWGQILGSWESLVILTELRKENYNVNSRDNALDVKI
jgi:hypothetical protein